MVPAIQVPTARGLTDMLRNRQREWHFSTEWSDSTEQAHPHELARVLTAACKSSMSDCLIC